MVLDGNWLVHLPKLAPWLAFQANLIYILWKFYQLYTYTEAGCRSPHWLRVSSALVAVRQ